MNHSHSSAATGAAHAEGEVQARLLLDSITGLAISMLDTEGYVRTWNPGAERLKGYSAAEIQGQHFSCFYTAADRDSNQPAQALQTARENGRCMADGWRVHKNGTTFWAGSVIQPIYTSGDLVGFASFTRDLSEQRAAADSLAGAHRNLRISLEHMSQGLALFDEAGSLVLARNAEVGPGMPVAAVLEAIGLSHDKALSLAQRVRELNAVHAVDTCVEEIGSTILSVVTTSIPDGGWVLTVTDITEQRRADEKLAHMAHHDALTGLPNRTLFADRLRQAIQSTRRGTPFALLSLDLNGFKAVNDTYGHLAGDELLRTVAYRLRQCVREVDLVARLGGDEFAIIQTNAMEEEADLLARRVIQTLAQPYTVQGTRVTAGTAVGIALAPRHGADPDELVKKADLALYKAKRDKSNAPVVFDAELAVRYDSRNLIERDLRDAIHRDEFQLYYQPLADTQSGATTGFEALVRWIHPERGMVSPAEFIPIAEETGLIVPLGEWVLRTACAEAATWEGDQHIAVNLSPVQFRNENLVAVVAAAVNAAGLDPRRLELEVTESVLLQNSESTLTILHRLQLLGVRIALDDFGTGYSSLGYLRSFPFNKLKIDRSFIQDLDRSPKSRAIVQAVTALGGSFNMSVTAEGVESLEQLEILRAEGCDEIQGFLMSRPKPAAELAVTRKHPAEAATPNEELAAA